MTKRRFIQCDVFTSTPTRGNGLAVVVDSQGMSQDQMQAFAAWTNLAETTFLLPPHDTNADYRLKIFTPTREMPFAGHPTLGSCASWLHCGGKPKSEGTVRQECGVGIVDIDITGKIPAFVAPPTKVSPMSNEALTDISTALELKPDTILRTTVLDNGPVWQVFELRSAADVLAVDSSKVRWPRFKAIGLIGAHQEGSEEDYEVRMLAPSSGMSEDPTPAPSMQRWRAGWLQKVALNATSSLPRAAPLAVKAGSISAVQPVTAKRS
jgi:PhzF family phenazine biosynthesis protein